MSETAWIGLVTLAGIFAVIIIDSLGAIASRQLKFNYGWLTILSLAVYASIGYYLGNKTSFEMSLIASFTVGIFDAVIGSIISEKFNANMGISKEELKKITLPIKLTVMLFIAFICGYIGFTVAGR